jgi:CrcB protein
VTTARSGGSSDGGERRPVPLHFNPAAMLVVFVGGGLGTLCRYLLSIAIPPIPVPPSAPIAGWFLGGIPISTMIVNVVGAFLLGALLSGIARRGAESRRGRALRLLIGTGFMGGFTTYSSLAVETVGLGAAAHPWYSVGYALVTLIVGLAASLAGIALGSAVSRPRASSAGGHGRTGGVP